jgi:hypothetical protein
MLVSQYIYTACGKDRNGAFSVFSKSKDITETESSEIREVMMYKTPSGLPYEPTGDEIEQQFPKKFGYFFLSSGRACLAQVCYTGRVYSDLDTRWGNYIIHAFVFEKTNNFAPYSFIEHSVFKRNLTKKEWHDDPIPDDLPKIEIPENGGTLAEGDVTGFFTEDRKNKLKLLVEALISSSNEDAISFNDDHKNQKFWFMMLSLCLPLEKQNEITFCTHFTNTIIPGNISSHIQVRANRPESPQFSYVQEAQRGHYAFDFLQNIIPQSVKPGKYAESTIKLLSSGISKVGECVNNINKVMSVYSVNINEASDLISINEPDYSNFDNVDEIYNTILTVDRVGYETQSIAKNLWTKKPQVNFNAQQRLSVLAFIYKNISDIKIKVEIIKTVIDEAKQLGINSDSASAFCDDLKTKANFIFENFYDYLKNIGLTNYVKENQNSIPKLFLVFDFLSGLQTVKNSFQAKNYNDPEEIKIVKSIMSFLYKKQSISEIELFIKSANSHINNFGIELLSVIIQNENNSGTHAENIQFAFEIIRFLQSKTDIVYKYLLNLIKTNSEKEEFIKAYISAQNRTPDFYKNFENENSNESLMKDFCGKKDAYNFINQTLTLHRLKEYFDKYYVKGADSGIFIKCLGKYLNAVQPEKKITEYSNILNTIKLPSGADNKLLPPVYRVVLEDIFSQEYGKIYDLCKKQEWYNKINEIYNVIEKAGCGLKQETRELVMLTLCGKTIEKYDFKDSNQHILSFFSKPHEDADNIAAKLEIINTDKKTDIFFKYYFQPIVNILIFGATMAKEYKYEETLEKAFGTIIVKWDLEKITDNIITGIGRTRTNSIAFILFIFRKLLANSQKPLDKNYGSIAEKYFKKLKPSERKKKFSELLAKAEDTETAQFERYFDDFNKEHNISFMDKLFGKK